MNPNNQARLRSPPLPAPLPSGVHALECNHLRGNRFVPQAHQQKAVQIYRQLERGQRGILLYHKFGSGKTCTSILVADDLLQNSGTLTHVWVLTPGNLRRNFHHEYCFVCGKYVADFKDNYTFISYNYGGLKPSDLPNFDDSVIIIDEIHNLINAYVNSEFHDHSIAKALIDKLAGAVNVKIIALSGDPIYSRPLEAGILFELLKPSLGRIDIDQMVKRPAHFKNLIRNLISYVPGKTEDFPQIAEQIVECKMSPSQTANFIPIEESERRIRRFPLKRPLDQHKEFNNRVMTAKLYIRTRRASNFCYPAWAGLNIEWEKEDGEESERGLAEIEDDSVVEVKEEGSSHGGDVRPPPAVGYLVVGREGLPLSQTYSPNSPLVKHLKRGDRFTEASFLHRKSFADGTTKWFVNADNAEGWITLPANRRQRSETVRSARAVNLGDYLAPKGWVDGGDFAGRLETYSQKFYAVLQNISAHFPGKHAIFSFFKTRGGLRLMGAFLDWCGIGYRVYTGDETDDQKTRILTEYNSDANADGALIKVLLFSFAGSEGMSLTAVRHLHILETDLREGRARQVIGRTARYKSHAMLPEENRKVQVWRYWSVTSFNEEDDRGIDRKLYNNARLRYEAIQQLLIYFQEASIENASDPDETSDSKEVKPEVTPEFQEKEETNIRYALNRLLYGNYKALTGPQSPIWRKGAQAFRESLNFPPEYIFQINKNNTISRIKASQFKGSRIRREYLHCKRLGSQTGPRDIELLQTIREQGHASELLNLFPLILNDIQQTKQFFASRDI